MKQEMLEKLWGAQHQEEQMQHEEGEQTTEEQSDVVEEQVYAQESENAQGEQLIEDVVEQSQKIE